MKNTLKFLGIGFALVLLVMSQQFGTAQPAEAANKVAEDDVQWLSIGGGTAGTANAADKADKVKYYAPGDVASFFIRDTALNPESSGMTKYICDADGEDTVADANGDAAATSEAINLKATADHPGKTGGVNDKCAATEHTYDGSATSSSYDGTNTPLVPGSLVLKLGNAIVQDVASLNENTGVFSITGAKKVHNGSAADKPMMTGQYKYNLRNTYANSGTSDLTALRAHVVSTSDATGEWVQIVETDSEGGAHDVTTATDSNIFVGRIAFSTDAAAAAAETVSNSVRTIWVADGDTVTVTYYGAGTDANADGHLGTSEVGDVIDTATFTIDSQKPTVTNISPADGTLTKDTSPQISFTIEDAGIGFESTSSTIGNHVDLVINGCNVLDTELNASSHSTSSITITYDLDVTKVFSDKARNADNTADRDCSENAKQRLYAGSGFNVVTTGTQTDTTLDRTINGTAFQWKIVARDDAGNTETIETTKLDLYVDSLVPTVTSVKAGQKWDAINKTTTTDEASDTIEILMGESIDSTTVAASDFIVSGTGVTDSTITAVSLAGDDATSNRYIYLTLGADLGPNATPKVELVGQISDLAGNVYKVAAGDADGKETLGTATDGVKPTISGVSTDDNSLDDDEKATMTFASNENLVASGAAAPDCTCAYVYGDLDGGAVSANATFVPTGAENNDFIKVAVTLTGTQAGKVELTEGSSPLTKQPAIYGVTVKGRDAAGKTGLGGLTKITNEDISDKFVAGDIAADGEVTVKLKNGPIGDPAAGDNGDLRTGTITITDDGSAKNHAGAALAPTIKNIDWSSAEEITFTPGAIIKAGSQVRLTYHVFNAENIIEVDNAAPSVTVTPGADSSTENARTRITLAFDEDEYAFDSMTTVTVTKAELKDVTTKEVTDILGSLITSDNKSFYYKPTADLNLGQYEVKVSANDVNGNKLTDSTSKFTVIERAKTTIAMEAGWNLMSLPSTPADTAINSVITNEEVTTVLTYDPTIPGGWLTAVRDGGVLSGTLTTMDASRAYWVYQEDGDDIKTLIPGASSGVSQAPPAIDVVKGWNLVPVVSLNNTAGYVEADDYFANIDWNKAQTWNATLETWTTIYKGKDAQVDSDGDGVVDADDKEDILTGKGYWVFANKAGTIVP